MQDRQEYLAMARTLVGAFQAKQGQNIYGSLERKNVDALNVDRDKILRQITSDMILTYSGKLEEEEMELILKLVEAELWGYGILTPLIDDKNITDIKLYGPSRIRIKTVGKRMESGVNFENESEYRTFVTRILEKNKVNLGTANAIQTFTDPSQKGFALRITVISGLLTDSGLPVVAIRKIPREKLSLGALEKAGMFLHQGKQSEGKERHFVSDRKLNQILGKMLTSKGILFTGKGASGKTTLMNAMIAEIPDDESVMICQENSELFDNGHPDMFSCHVLRNRADSKVSYELGDLTRAALLVDLDRVIVGEVKDGSEAAGLSKASMTGHKCWTSVHGENCEMAVDKMADYISQALGYSTGDAMRQLMGFSYIVHLKDFHIDEIKEIVGWDKEKERLIFKTVYPTVEEEDA